MDEEVLAALVRGDEAEALVVVEPLDGSGCHAFLHGSCCNCVRGVSSCTAATTTYAGSYPPYRHEPTMPPGARHAACKRLCAAAQSLARQLAREAHQERRVVVEVARQQAPRLLGDPVGPFETALLHPGGRLRDPA